ncbi:MAG: lysophospholipid acyltransferase family protein [Acidimicrobiales bacterium]
MAHDEGDYGRLFPVARAVLAPVMRFAWRIHTEGLENIPSDGPAILCPNHTSVLDSFFLPVALLPVSGSRRVMFVGKAEYLDSWKTRYVFPAMGMIPIDRSGGEAAQRALDLAAEALGRGELFGIYPEGTRSRDGRLHKGHTGPARLAFRTGAPLVPVGIVGSRRIQPPDAKMPRVFEPCLVRIGRPIDPKHYSDRAEDRLVLRQVTDELMFEIRGLSGQEYVDDYATRGRGNDAEGPVARSSADVLATATVR